MSTFVRRCKDLAMAGKPAPLPFSKPWPWAADPDNEGETTYFLRSRIPVERWAVVAMVAIGDEEHLRPLGPVVWSCAAAEQLRTQMLEEFPDCVVLGITSVIEVGNDAHDEALLKLCERIGGHHGQGVQ